MAMKSTDQPKTEGKKEEGVHLKYDLLSVKLNFNDKVASCQLRMPSTLPRGFTSHGEDPTVALDLILSDEDLRHNFKLMKEIVHPNVLHARLVHKNELSKRSGSVKTVDHWGLVEPYSGILFEYLVKDLAVPLRLKSGVVVLPHDILRDIVRKIVDGLEHLMIYGYYHGNFTLKSTFYHQNEKPNGGVTVKLAGFKKKSEKKSVCQKLDLFALGDQLEVISTIAKDTNQAADANNSGFHFDTFQIDDLVKKLKLVTEANLPQIYGKIKRHVFFWELIDRQNFFLYRVAVALKNKGFEARLDSCEAICVLEWNVDTYDGYLQKANKYRVDNNKKVFDGKRRSHFVKFASGLYTHEHKLTEVDSIVVKRHPHFCTLLMNMLGADEDE